MTPLFAPQHAPRTPSEMLEELEALGQCLARRGDRRGADVVALAAEVIRYPLPRPQTEYKIKED